MKTIAFIPPSSTKQLNEIKPTFGTFVREKRLEKKFGLNNFAKMVNTSVLFISKMEAGEYKAPCEVVIARIAEKLDINADYLLALAGKISTENKNKMIDKIIEENKPIKVFTKEQKIAFDKLKMRINDIECSYYFQCPFNFFQSDMNGNLILYNALTIENIDKNYVFERLMSAKEHIMAYDSKIKNEDDTFEKTELRTVYKTPLHGYDVVPEVMFYKKKDAVMVGLKWIHEAELCLMAI